MTETWPKAIEFVLRHEGGYSNDPNDPGGETNWGISKRSYPDRDIKNLTIDQAKDIYYNDYWLKNDCEIREWPLDLILFDTAVNMGSKRAKVLQQESFDWKDYLISRIAYYRRLNKDRYFKGWVNRVLDLYVLIKG